MKKLAYVIVLFSSLQSCYSQNINNTHFIYHSTDFDSTVIYKEVLYNSYTGIYEYRELINNKIDKDISIFIKLEPKILDEINHLYLLSKSDLSDCYYENNTITHKSTITFDSQKDNFSLIKCNNHENQFFIEMENKIENYITSSSVYQSAFYWKSYKK